MIKMKVSIIIPVFHVEKFIQRCVASVLKQNYRPLEVIFVDDASCDKSLELAKQEIRKQNNVGIEFQYIIHEKNQGLSAARNTGIKSATGNYLYFLDSDDAITEDAIDVLVKKLDKYPDSDIVHGRMVLENGADYHHLSNYISKEFVSSNELIRKWHFSLNPLLPDSACDKLIKKTLITDNNLYFKKGIIFEDTHWVNRVVKKLYYISYASSPTYIRYINPGTIMTSLSKNKEMKNLGIVLEDLISEIDEPCYDAQLFSYFKRFLVFYDFSGGAYGFSQLYQKFNKLFFSRGYYTLAIVLLLYKIKFHILPDKNIKARLRGYMYKTINAFFDQK